MFCKIELVAGSGVAVEEGKADGGGVRRERAKLEEVVEEVRRVQMGWERAGVMGQPEDKEEKEEGGRRRSSRRRRARRD